jgi:hypothetical protein
MPMKALFAVLSVCFAAVLGALLGAVAGGIAGGLTGRLVFKNNPQAAEQFSVVVGLIVSGTVSIVGAIGAAAAVVVAAIDSRAAGGDRTHRPFLRSRGTERESELNQGPRDADEARFRET